MKKLNLIIGKRQIVIVALLITLSVAAFLNWQFATGDQAVTVDLTDQNEEKNDSQNYGDAELVRTDKRDERKNNYLKQAKIDKQKAYDEANDNNSQILNSQNLSAEDRSKIIDNAINLNNRKETESRIETQIKQLSFVKECAVYVSDETVSVTVQLKESDELNENKATQIAEAVKREIDVESSKIVITPVQNKQ